MRLPARLVTTAAGSCASASVPEILAADMELAVAALPLMLMAAVPALKFAGFKPVSPPPLPKKDPPKLPNRLPDSVTPVALFVINTAGSCASGTTPLTWLTGSGPARPLAVPARMAYGVGVTGWREVNVVKAVAPFVRTPISSQRAGPVNTPLPKSSVIVNSPLVTGVAALVTVPPALPPPAAS